jgi:fido (protein-threonine AMPylation protein)
LKTTNVPIVGECPKWTADVPKEYLSNFRRRLGDVYQAILEESAAGHLDAGQPRRWHAHLFSEIVPLPCYAGNYRSDIGHPCLACDVEVAGVRGAPFAQTSSAVQLLADQAKRHATDLELEWSSLPATERCFRVAVLIANLVGIFIRIHPFVNGNGRTSRLIWRYGLFRFGVPIQVYTHPRPPQPYDDLMAAAMAGDIKPLILYVLQHLQSNAPHIQVVAVPAST